MCSKSSIFFDPSGKKNRKKSDWVGRSELSVKDHACRHAEGRPAGDDPHVPDSRLSSKLPFPWGKTSSFPTSRRGNLAMRNEPHKVNFGVKNRGPSGGAYEDITRSLG